MTDEAAREVLDRVRAYYDDTTPVYLKHLGSTLQAGLYGAGGAVESNLVLAARAGIRAGDRILDAGCGVGGPMLDIGKAFPGVSIEGITLSPVQALTAARRIAEAGLAERLHVRVGDYHSLPFDAGAFDVVCFFECTTYSYDLERIFREAFRVLSRGGSVYVKDVLLKEGTLTEKEAAEIREFDEMFRVYRTYPLSDGVKALEKAGFAEIRSENLDDRVSTDQFMKAMFEFDKRGQPVPNEFGRLHFRQFDCLPTVYGELRARKPR